MVEKLNVLEFKSSEEKVYANGLTDKMISDRELALKESCRIQREKNKNNIRSSKLQRRLIWIAISILTNDS